MMCEYSLMENLYLFIYIYVYIFNVHTFKIVLIENAPQLKNICLVN